MATQNRASRRATKTPYMTLDAWSHSRIQQVDLDGQVVDFWVPSLMDYIALGQIPNPLRAVAQKIEGGMLEEQALTDEERQDYLRLQATIIVRGLRKPNPLEEFGEEKAVEWVIANMPKPHRMKLWALALHADGFQTVDADTAAALKTLVEMSRFRDGKGLDQPAGGGGKNGESAE